MQTSMHPRPAGASGPGAIRSATGPSAAARALQSLLDREARRRDIGGVLLGVRSGDGRIDFDGAAGGATPGQPFLTASICKMFTAAVLMQLVDEGAVDLDDAAAAHLPHLDLGGMHVWRGADLSGRISLRQLVHQTSGLADYFEGRALAQFTRGEDRAYDLSEVIEIVRGMAPVAAPGGGRSHYSDTNYRLLGAVIEAVTGRDLPAVFAERIFEPAGMTDTYVVGDPGSTGRPATVPLGSGARRIEMPLALSSMAADGGCVWTCADALRFLQAYFGGRLFDASNLAAMTRWNDMGFPLRYGYGLMRFKLPRWMTPLRASPEFIGHSGVSGAWAFYAPGEDLFLAGSVNQLDARRRPFRIMPEVARIVARARP